MIFPTKPPWLRPGAAPNHPTSDHFYHVIQGSSKMFKKKSPPFFGEIHLPWFDLIIGQKPILKNWTSNFRNFEVQASVD
jgi:hypothetical protein